MRTTIAALAVWVICLPSPFGARAEEPSAALRPNLSGAWSLNKSMGTAPGSGGTPDVGTPGDRPGGRGGMGGGRPGGRRGGLGGGMGRPGGGGGARPSDEDMAARQALMEEVLQLPPRVTIAQDGDRVTFIEPDGVVRTYVANGKSEKHQLTAGTIETKSRWDGTTFVIELEPGPRVTLTRTYAVLAEPRRLEVTTAFDGARRDVKRVAVYEVLDGDAPRPPQ